MATNEQTLANVTPAPAPSQQPGPTLLPGPIASAVSLATRSTSFAIRFGSFVGSYGIDAARVTTLSSLELARGLVEVVLTRAGKDILDTSRSSLAAADAETVLERSLESLHFAVVQAVFWTSASFRLTDTTLSVASGASQLVLSSLDQLLGSTDSSRAVASIITLIRREFRSPATGGKGERVGVLDLVLALSALAYLQQSCRKTPEEEKRRKEYAEVIWDVVVLNDGERVDVADDGTPLRHGYEALDAQRDTDDTLEEDDAVIVRLKDQIAASLPPDTTVSISNSVSSIQTITVDIDGSELSKPPTLPGAEIVETTLISKPTRRSWIPFTGTSDGKSSYRVVYRIQRDKFRSVVFHGDDEGDFETGSVVGEITDELDELDTKVNYDPATGTFTTAAIVKKLPDIPIEPSPTSTPKITEPSVTQSAPLKSQQKSEKSHAQEHAANQKKQRSPPNAPLAAKTTHQRTSAVEGPPVKKKKTETTTQARTGEKRPGLKQVLKGGSQSISNIWNRDGTDASPVAAKSKPQWKAPQRGMAASSATKPSALPIRPQNSSHGTNAVRRSAPTPESLPRTSSRASYVSIQEHRRNSVVSQTDSYSVSHTGDLRPASPTIRRSDITSTHENTIWPRNEGGNASYGQNFPLRGHRRYGSHAPSIYSLGTNDSRNSLALSSFQKKSAYSAANAIDTLRREGFVDGTFPGGHVLPNITRYMRFSSACYGSQFLKFMGISEDVPTAKSWDSTHQDVRHFAHHTESDAGNILLASFVDPQGGSDASGSTGTGVPLIHYVSLDHEAKAVVLACRGTLGFEDVLTDMTCDYDDLHWKGRSYKVHKGMHASARRLLYGGDGRVLVTLKAALNEFPEYGLVLCGHSLGAGVTSLLGLMLSEPNRNGPGFVTASGTSAHAKLLTDGSVVDDKFSEIQIPAERRIHVYAYGPPGVMCSSLRQVTRGLITSVVHGSDLVPHLSLGLLHDFQALALAFKNKENRTKTEIRARVWAAFHDNLSGAKRIPGNDEDKWMLPALEALRSTMTSEKLLPPGEVFTIESQSVLRRDAFMLASEGHLGRPAQRVILKYIRDVEQRFGEVRFGTSMLTDHSPANYEKALNRLKMGVVE